MGGIADHIAYSIFLLILAFLVFTNYKGLVAIMAQGGSTVSQVSKTLQGR